MWAVLNSVIYNHVSLRDHLCRRGHSFASQTDTEVLVHLYEEYGEALVHAVEGMYAFAIWDREKRLLTIARDRFGEKPLFYAEQGDSLVFASELTALRAGLPKEPEIDPRLDLGPGEGDESAQSRSTHRMAMRRQSTRRPR